MQPAERSNVPTPVSIQADPSAPTPAIASRRKHSGYFRDAASALVLAALIGCGNTYRPVVTAINPVGPASQPQKYAVAISSTGATTPGLVTIVDFSGDTVLVTANIGPDPKYFVMDSAGSNGYTLNGDGTLTSFDVSNQLISSAVLQSTLLAGSNPISVFPQGTYVYVSEPGRGVVGQFSGTPPALRQELTVGDNVVYVVGANAAQRLYALVQGSGTAIGQAAAIDVASNAVTTTVPVGITPVYGVMTADFKRAYIMNKGSNTVSVINAQTNALDSFTGSSAPGTISVGTAPVWADFATTRSELVVANAGTGSNQGSLSVVSIPLCNAAAAVTNPNCDPTNPVDAAGFGTVLASVPVGVNPVNVAVLADGTRAYVANGGDPSLPCATVPVAGVSTGCSVSVVNLTSNVVTATIPVSGHPNFLAVSNATPTGKVYVTSADNSTMTIIRTDTDTLQTTVDLQGKGVMVRVTAP
ncbi:40-residue YVTN family beta-propeller repeat protein [Granulicella sibirica]|uniref:40-residue YVTN family beta-propeller repeat protein n=1 Tax=Granulicella sibirica TaxID=2479048 RepID=A0A4V1L5C6_9BACT|nr:40-residue YVTN family beta-propeller repeat protein [Granulicella sibirica]